VQKRAWFGPMQGRMVQFTSLTIADEVFRKTGGATCRVFWSVGRKDSLE